MSGRTATKPKPSHAAAQRLTGVLLREGAYRLGKPERVDRDKGIIYGVKVLGLESVNGRRYTLEAIQKAAALYEGLAVNVDHPAKADDPRSAHDRFGWLENIRVKDDGLYGDLHLLDPGDPLARKLLKAAEERPDVYGLSHNANGDGHRTNDGIFVIEAIVETRSVDIVADPATTNGLFESRNNHRQRQPMKLKAFLEAIAKVKSAPKKSLKALKKLVEGDDMPDMEMDDDMGEPPADDAVASDWRKALADLYAMLKATEDEEAHAVADKLHGLLKLPAATEEEEDSKKKDEEETDVEEEREDVEERWSDGTGADNRKEEKAMFSAMRDRGDIESRQPRRRKPSDPAVHELQEQLKIRDLIEDAALKFTKPESRKAFIKSLIPLTEGERKALVEERKTLMESDARRGAPRNSGPDRQHGGSNGNGNTIPKFPTSREEAKRLLS